MTLANEMESTDTVAFTLRPVRQDDLEAVVTLMNAAAAAQKGHGQTDAADLARTWRNFNVEKSARAALLPNGRMVGYVEVWDTDPIPVNNWVWARVHPEFEGQGIGTAMMDWAEERLQETVARVEEGLQVCYVTGPLHWHQPSTDLMQDRGMELVRHFWRMVIDLDDTPQQPQWPAGITLKTLAEQDDLLAVYRAQDEAFRDHWGYVDQPEAEDFAEWKQWMVDRKDFDPRLWFLAMDGDEIAGVCLCRRDVVEDPDMGWVSELAVRKPWRRRGLGLAMLHHAFAIFSAEGKQRVGLGVDAASLTGATRLYEKAGMHVARRFDNYRKIIRSGRDITQLG